jgi:hypothetical protein
MQIIVLYPCTIYYLMRMFHVHTKPQFFQHSPLSLDDLVLQINIVLIQKDRLNRPRKEEKNKSSEMCTNKEPHLLSPSDLFYVVENRYHISYPSRGLFNFRS